MAGSTGEGPTSVRGIYEALGYGPAREGAGPAQVRAAPPPGGLGGCPDAWILYQAWLDAHGRSLGHFIDGKWSKPEGRETWVCKSPATGKSLATTLQGQREDVEAAVQAATKGFETWSQLACHARARHLYNLTRMIQKHQNTLTVLESLDTGKPVTEARVCDLPLIVRHFYHHAGWAQLMRVEMGGWEPLGVVSTIIPSGSPLVLLAWKVCPALAMGNTVVVLAPPTAQLSALLLAELCTQAGLPSGILNVITGAEALAGVLATHPGVDAIAFTGSAELGRSLRQVTAGLGKRLSLQLGGRTPVLIFESADLDSAATELTDTLSSHRGLLLGGGAPLILVQEAVAGALVQRLKARLGALRVGEALDRTTDVGGLVDEVWRAALQAHVDEAEAEGAEVFQSWPALPAQGSFYPPTLIIEADTTSRCVREEVFGPVLVVLPFRTTKEAIALANSTPGGLAASIWTEKLPLAMEVACSLQVGTVWINGQSMYDAAASFGGCKESGFGCSGGKEGLYEYVRPSWESRIHSRATDMNYKTFAASSSAAPFHVPGQAKDPHSGPTQEAHRPSVDRTYKLYYGGAQKRSEGLSSRPILDPTGHLMAYIADGSAKDVRNAVEAAHKAAPGWRGRSAHARAQVLFYMAENLGLRQAELAAELAALMGATPEQAAQEVELSLERLFHWAASCDKHGGGLQDTPLYGTNLLLREPLGVLGIVCPDENPLLSFISLWAPAVAWGNAVIIIPSQCYPLPALGLCQVLDTSDLPGGVLNVITGDCDHLARTLALHQDVQALWYFGSQQGSQLVEWASAGNLKRTWVSCGARRCWEDPSQGAGEEFLSQATHCKSIWVPMGDVFAN
ncbi:aldehyde dehydrogenase family 16 member A1 isoform X2 [Alligator mississippiensis]|uniref:aldehyde dehydrogenase family 16 member A1 isoform X2 n=1 Tax=Alligator mississippiensis TaxID=8496 RepID=UPI0009074819|nr:aldehyde dehydrogenase family 16 member A1 isoform X2 [Alligator mississippiensis]